MGARKKVKSNVHAESAFAVARVSRLESFLSSAHPMAVSSAYEHAEHKVSHPAAAFAWASACSLALRRYSIINVPQGTSSLECVALLMNSFLNMCRDVLAPSFTYGAAKVHAYLKSQLEPYLHDFGFGICR